jgi:hypothetical protein
MSGFTLCSLVQSLENATLPVVGTALTGLTLEALTTSACVQVFGRRDDGLTMDCGGRRPKSAKARSRGKLGTGGATGAMGI